MNKIGAALGLLICCLLLCPPIGVNAQTWSGIYVFPSSSSVYILHYYLEDGLMVGIEGTTVKLYIDGNYITSYIMLSSGLNVVIPEAYRTPGWHYIRVVYEGGEYLPAEGSASYGSGEDPIGTPSKNHIIINSTGGSSYSEFVTNTSDFNGYWFIFSNATVINYREWWQFETFNDLSIILNVSTSGGTLLAVTKLSGSTAFFGLMDVFHVSVGASDEADSWDQISLVVPPFYSYGVGVTGWNPEEFQLFIVPEANQTKLVWVWNIGGKNVAYTQICDVVLDGPATVTLAYDYEGQGYIEGYVTDSFSLPSLPYYEDFKSGVTGWLSEVLGIDLGGAAYILMEIVVLFLAIVQMTIPLLGAIVFLWIMDTVFTAVTTGRISLIGDMFMKIYEFLMMIWNTLVSIVRAIWDFITFWS